MRSGLTDQRMNVSVGDCTGMTGSVMNLLNRKFGRAEVVPEYRPVGADVVARVFVAWTFSDDVEYQPG